MSSAVVLRLFTAEFEASAAPPKVRVPRGVGGSAAPPNESSSERYCWSCRREDREKNGADVRSETFTFWVKET